MSWTAILVLACGAYILKALGLLVFGPATLASGRPDDVAATPSGVAGLPLRVGQLLPPALLAALVVSQTVVTGTDLVIDARIAGVLAGAVAVWRKAPFWLVLVIAASVSAAIRFLNG
ncbi:MAG: AzlD domain-containing protein [Acidimicrobiales bacterium]